MKITPAMKAWCRHLNGGGKIRRLAATLFSCQTKGGLTYAMMFKLEDAGLVEFQGEVVALTAAGREACS